MALAKAVVTASSSSSGRENETFMLLGTVLTWGGGVRVCSSIVEMCAEHRRNTARLSTWSRSVRRAPPAPSTSEGPRVRLPETHVSALRAKKSEGANTKKPLHDRDAADAGPNEDHSTDRTSNPVVGIARTTARRQGPRDASPIVSYNTSFTF